MIFVEGGKPENPEKNPQSRDENQQQTQPTCDTKSQNQTQATVVGDVWSHHCANPAPLRVGMVIEIKSIHFFYYSKFFFHKFCFCLTSQIWIDNKSLSFARNSTEFKSADNLDLFPYSWSFLIPK